MGPVLSPVVANLKDTSIRMMSVVPAIHREAYKPTSEIMTHSNQDTSCAPNIHVSYKRGLHCTWRCSRDEH